MLLPEELAEHIRIALVRAPGIIGEPYSKRPFVEMYFSTLRLGLDVLAENMKRSGAEEDGAIIERMANAIGDPKTAADAHEAVS